MLLSQLRRLRMTGVCGRRGWAGVVAAAAVAAVCLRARTVVWACARARVCVCVCARVRVHACVVVLAVV